VYKSLGLGAAHGTAAIIVQQQKNIKELGRLAVASGSHAISQPTFCFVSHEPL
jgi:hypothetical protein